MHPAGRWHLALEAAEIRDPEDRVLAELVELHRERHRRYHDLRHVVSCLEHLASLPVEGTDHVALPLAFWFHDAIYAPLRKDNEEASARLASRRLQVMGATASLLDKIQRLILVTRHTDPPADLDEALMVDVDLAILGSPRVAFETYEAEIRQEYRLVPGPLYRRKRRRVLEAFLERRFIYATPEYRASFEEQARANLAWALAHL